MSDSKSKVAENAMGLLRTTVAWLMAEKPPSERKWRRHVDQAVASLNSQSIEIDGHHFCWTPADINKSTSIIWLLFFVTCITEFQSFILLNLKLRLNCLN